MDPAIVLTLRICFLLLFAAAAAHKIRDPLAFRDTLGGYELLPARFVGVAGVLLMGTELVIAAGVTFVRAAGYAAALVLAAYTAAIVINLWRGRTDLNCGCMGPAASAPISGWLVARNALLVAAAVAMSAAPRARELVAIDALTVAGGASTLIACWLASERLLAMAPSLGRLRSAKLERAR